ncbi:hypothetical protein V1515DRAFT_605937, partial [Lipomyces mesembrius]
MRYIYGRRAMVCCNTRSSGYRVLALWIHRSPQRKQKWNDVCKISNLTDKFIEYDFDTRWNSTFRMLDDALQAREQSQQQEIGCDLRRFILSFLNSTNSLFSYRKRDRRL